MPQMEKSREPREDLVVPEIDDPAEPVAAPSAAAYRVDAVGEGVAKGRVPVTRRT